MTAPLVIAMSQGKEIALLPQMSNRHGLITGATGTGKTVTLQKMAESFASIGVPVFMADVKGDLSGIGAAGASSEKLLKRLEGIGIKEFKPRSNTTVFWDVYGKSGHPVRATVSDMGPLLLARLLNLNDTQSGVLQIVFKIADDNKLLLIDLKDLRAMNQYVGDNAKQFKTVLGQLGNRVQHALRAFTPRDQQAVKTAASTMRQNPAFDAMQAITELGVGEALISFLDEKGRPSIVERSFVIVPFSRMGAMTNDERLTAIKASTIYGHYEKTLDRESAYEKLRGGEQEAAQENKPAIRTEEPAAPAKDEGGLLGGIGGGLGKIIFGSTGPRGGQREGMVQAAAKSMARTIGTS
ncbi:MAG: helicase HerA-like domain-containing protein [Smithella sp.]|jgi:DNA helicase HerA-like ATPase